MINNNSIVVENARLNILDIDKLAIPLNKFVIVTGSSGSGKTSLIYNTIAKEAELLFSGKQEFIIDANKEFYNTTITGLTPVKTLKQKFSYFQRRVTFSQLIDIDKYINLLYANYAQIKNGIGNNLQVFTANEIFQLAESLPRLSDEILDKRGYNYRYNYAYPLHLALVPNFVWFNEKEREQLTHAQILDANKTNINLLKNLFKNRFDYVLVNNEIIVDFLDLEELIEKYDYYIHSLDVCFATINKTHTIEIELLQQLQDAITLEEKTFDELINLNISADISLESLYQKLGLSYKPSKKSYAKAQINKIRTVCSPSIKLYSPATHSSQTYALNLVVQVEGDTKEVDLKNPTTFNSLFSKSRCKTCKGLGEINEKSCPDCHGDKFEPIICDLQLFGVGYAELYRMTSRQALKIFQQAYEQELKAQNTLSHSVKNLSTLKITLLKQLVDKLALYIEIGLGYIQLNRRAQTLSGGEIQRANLVHIINNKTCNVTYILDEPSIGLHPDDNIALIKKLHQLVANGNSVIVIEHDADFIKHAEHLIVLDQGKIQYQGSVDDLLKTDLVLSHYLKHKLFISQRISEYNINAYKKELQLTQSIINQTSLSNIIINTEFTPKESITLEQLQYLASSKQLSLYDYLSPYNPQLVSEVAQAQNIVFKDVYVNYFKHVDITLKKGLINVITGVSGSGKSTFANQILNEAVSFYLNNCEDLTTTKMNKALKTNFSLGTILGLGNNNTKYFDHLIFASQKPTNSSLDLIDYFKLSENLSKIFQDASHRQHRAKNLKASNFLLTTINKTHRCLECKGKRKITVALDKDAEEQIMCPECNGSGFSPDVLSTYLEYDKFSNVKFNIADFYNMSVQDAYEFFIKYHKRYPSTPLKKLINQLAILKRFRLHNLVLGRSVNDFSGGELQRVYLSREIMSYTSSSSQGRLLIVMDEPTTGLHYDDIQSLLDFLVELKQMGNTIVVIEHNLDLIYNADYLVELGPGPDVDGGNVIFNGSISQILDNYYSIKNNTNTTDQNLYTPMTKYLGELDQIFIDTISLKH